MSGTCPKIRLAGLVVRPRIVYPDVVSSGRVACLLHRPSKVRTIATLRPRTRLPHIRELL